MKALTDDSTFKKCVDSIVSDIDVSHPNDDLKEAFNQEYKVRDYVKEVLKCICMPNGRKQLYMRQEHKIELQGVNEERARQ